VNSQLLNIRHQIDVNSQLLNIRHHTDVNSQLLAQCPSNDVRRSEEEKNLLHFRRLGHSGRNVVIVSANISQLITIVSNILKCFKCQT
jgi:hypothetical protein